MWAEWAALSLTWSVWVFRGFLGLLALVVMTAYEYSKHPDLFIFKWMKRK